MSYDKGYRTKHSFTVTAGAAASTVNFKVPAPRGKSGRVIDYGMEGVTTAFTSVNTIAIGTTGDVDAYGEEFDIAGLGVGECKSVRQTYWPIDANSTTDMRDFIVGESTGIQTSTGGVWVTVVVATDGVGDAFVVMEWND